MSNKKQLLTETEMRRWQALANIDVIGKKTVNEMMGLTDELPPQDMRPGMGQPPVSPMAEADAMPPDMGAPAAPAPAGPPMPPEGGDEVMDLGGLGDEGEGEEGGMEGGDKESAFQEIVSKLADLLGVDIEIDGGGEEEAGMEDGEESETSGSEEGEESEESGEEEAGESEEGESEEEESKEELQESKKKLVEDITQKVLSRIIEEAKKKKAAKDKMKKKGNLPPWLKKKGDKKDEKKDGKKDDKKEDVKEEIVKEANAKAPKSSNSNASSNGVAKGHGPGGKEFGVTKQADQEWKEGTSNSKGGHKMTTVPAKGEHTTTHKKTSAVTGKGGNKTK